MKETMQRVRAGSPWIAAVVFLAASPASSAEVEVLLNGGAPGSDYYLALYRGADAYAREDRLEEIRVTAAEGVTRVVLKDVAPGEYLVSAYYDSNGDGTLGRGFFGAPDEPYGFSRNARGRFGPPSFEDAAFRVGEEPVRLEIHLR